MANEWNGEYYEVCRDCHDYPCRCIQDETDILDNMADVIVRLNDRVDALERFVHPENGSVSEQSTGEASADLQQTPSVSCWFVECVMDGVSQGWWTAPPPDQGPWLTTDPLEAKRYNTKAEAEGVAHALSYFRLRWSNWIATEHLFMDGVEQSSPSSDATFRTKG